MSDSATLKSNVSCNLILIFRPSFPNEESARVSTLTKQLDDPLAEAGLFEAALGGCSNRSPRQRLDGIIYGDSAGWTLRSLHSGRIALLC